MTWCKIWCIAKNPFENTTLPKIKRKPREIWDAATICKALDECKGGRLYVAINLSFAYSLRIGEIVGLTWDNIHISDADIASDNAYILFIQQRNKTVKFEYTKEVSHTSNLFVRSGSSGRGQFFGSKQISASNF